MIYKNVISIDIPTIEDSIVENFFLKFIEKG